jgi:hypothetical protein
MPSLGTSEHVLRSRSLPSAHLPSGAAHLTSDIQHPTRSRMSDFLQANSLRTIIAELFEGASPRASWLLNPGDAGLIAWLRGLSAEQASERVAGRASIAAHVNHMRFHLELLNRWADGEEPFSTADWTTSWATQSVDEGEWQELIEELAERGDDWQMALAEEREWDPITMTGAIASAAHLAYHFGTIRTLAAVVRA